MAGIVTRIVFILCVVASMILIVTSIVMIADRTNMNAQIKAGIEGANDVDVTKKVGPVNVHLLRFSKDSFDITKYQKIESSIPALEKALSDTPYSLTLGFTLLTAGLNVVLLAIAMFQLYSVFDIIGKEDSPFTQRVLKKLLFALIVIDIVIAFTAGLGTAAVAGLVTWALYTIMDYGRLLQTQSDETL
ncbi:MAG: hypothetical protein IKQ28_08080 [Lachnospiraceae bacterium]|nr:hypothetical protein [Lachnospiraceae bacterium]MBR6302551.1 hypothetical protein [Lachnospiraceae bacterium]MBR6909634.1 hypothetical protein [Lachnospiraceae bacterium]